MPIDRRDFLSAVAGVAAGTLLTSAAGAEGVPARAGTIPVRRLGSTGLEVPILSLGGFHLGFAPNEEAAHAVVEAALEEGIRFFDNAESYQSGAPERWLGSALAGQRDRVLLMSKTHDPEERSAETARRHLEGTLSRLRTDHLDLWQLHAVQSADDVDRAFRTGGAMEYLFKAKEERLVRFVGITGHATPAAHRRALDYWDRGFRFDTMQFPVNVVDYHQQSFQQALIPELVRRGIGVIAMKTSGQARLLRDGICTIEECLRYAWSLPISVAVVGMERPELVRRNAQLAREFTPMSEAELETLRERVQPKVRMDLESYKS